MTPVKRMRIFAGPNGSGKTTIFKGILDEKRVQLGVYVNADDIEAELNKTSELNFAKYELVISNKIVQDFFLLSTFAPIKRNEIDLWNKLSVENNVLAISTFIDSYLAADLAEFIRQQLLETGISFTYETVMSHSSKIAFLEQAQKKGYKVYLYYIATEDPEININRVSLRVAQEGHNVNPEVIKNRYFKSLNNLKSAVKKSNRAYVFDNSKTQADLVVEVTNGVDVRRNDVIDVPNWVANYLLK